MRFTHHLASVALAGALVLTGCDATSPATEAAPAAQNGDIIAGQYIVVMKDAPGATSRAAVGRLAAAFDVEDPILFDTAIAGFAGAIGADQLDALRNDPRIDYVEPDRFVALKRPRNPGGGGGGGGGGGDAGGGGTVPQSVPYGITRVNGGVASSARVCVVDSGVDLDHADLNVDRNASRTFIASGRDSRSADDGNGHGTHVAGTIGAIDNATGVIGVAAGATIVAVKVLNRRGNGSYSTIIAGIDYVASGAPGCSVANMSVGGPVSQAVDSAVLAAADNGVIMVLAAGNDSDDSANHSPARAGGMSSSDNVYTIAAINAADRFATFSNYGSGVEYAAPGAGILSTWKDGGYNTISGTSMAAPHAAGIFALGSPNTSGFARNDPDGKPDPIISN